MKKDRQSRLRADIENLKKELSFVESKILLLNPQNRELFELTPSEYRNFREAYFPVSEIKKSLVRKPTFVEKAKSMIYKPTIAEIVGDEGDNVTMNVKEVQEPSASLADFGEREREMERERAEVDAYLEERRRERAERRTMKGYDKNVGGSGIIKPLPKGFKGGGVVRF
jgi:DNA-binding transcriptional MerR regulator